jgi:hypothetical protein
MCYSKEVQLATSLIILLSALFFYFYYSKRYSKYPKQEQKWLKPFLNNVILIFVAIGGHQLFEFLSLITNNQLIYKIGLIISISAMFFMLRSLEIFTNKKFYSKFSIIIIIGVAIHALLNPLQFESSSFHLRHFSVFIWSCSWLLLFIYWHICTFSIKNRLDKKSKKTLFIYLLTLADISFILVTIYTIWGYFKFSVNVCTDSPSIWCTFFVIQALFIPFFLSTLPLSFNRPKEHSHIPFKTFIIYLLVSLVILLALLLILPFFKCLTWKFVFP